MFSKILVAITSLHDESAQRERRGGEGKLDTSRASHCLGSRHGLEKSSGISISYKFGTKYWDES